MYWDILYSVKDSIYSLLCWFHMQMSTGLDGIQWMVSLQSTDVSYNTPKLYLQSYDPPFITNVYVHWAQ